MDLVKSVNQLFSQDEGIQIEEPTLTPSTSSIFIPGDPRNNISKRQNNPFNLNYAGQPGARPGTGNPDGGSFAIFDTPDEGYAAGLRQIQKYQEKNPTLRDFISKYNVTAKPQYIRGILSLTGASLDTPIANIPTDVLSDAVARMESQTKRPPDWIPPVPGKPSSGFNDMRNQGTRQHAAYDFPGRPGDPFVAPRALTVRATFKGGRNMSPNDWGVDMVDDQGRVVKFVHTGNLSHLKPGQRFEAGQQIGVIGNVVSRPHLHVAQYDQQGNPIDFMQGQQNQQGQTQQQGYAEAPVSPDVVTELFAGQEEQPSPLVKIGQGLADLFGPSQAEAANQQPTLAGSVEALFSGSEQTPQQTMETSPTGEPITSLSELQAPTLPEAPPPIEPSTGSLPTQNIFSSATGEPSQPIDVEEELLSQLPMSSVKGFEPAVLKEDIGGAPAYEWLMWAGLLGASGMIGGAVPTALGLARLLGPRFGPMIARAVGMGTSGMAWSALRSSLEDLGIYHPEWSKEKHEGLTSILSPSSFIWDKPESEMSATEKMLAEGMNWAAFDVGLQGLGIMRGKKATEQFYKSQAEKIFEDRMGVPLSDYLAGAKPTFENVPKWVREQIPEYKSTFEKVADATYRKYVAEPIWDLLSKVGDIPAPFSRQGKTLKEAFQPAIERIRRDEPGLAKKIDETYLSRALTEEGMEYIARAQQTLNPQEFTEYIRGIITSKRGVSSSPKVEDLLTRFDSLIQTAGARSQDKIYTNEFLRQYNEQVGDALKLVEYRLTNWMKALRQDPSQATPVERYMSQKFKTDPAFVLKYYLRKYSQPMVADTPQAARNNLNKMISDPLLPDPIKRYAMDLYNLPADTPGQVRKSSLHALTNSIAAKLKNEPNAVSSLAKEGFVASKHPEFKDLYVSRDVEFEMDAIKSISKYAGGMYQKWFLTPWKTNKVVMRPSAHFRNLYSNMILNDLGGLPFSRVDMYMKALRDMRGETPEFKKFAAMTASAGRFSTEEIQRFSAMPRYGDNMLEKMHHAYEAFTSPARKMYGAEETWFKYAKYLHNMEKGMSRSEAALDAVKWTFNYGEITPAVASIRSHWAGQPFFTWMSKSIPLYLEQQLKYPLRTGKWWAMLGALSQYGIEQSGMTREEFDHMWGQLPDYIQKGMWAIMPWRDENDRLKMLNLTWMLPGIGDISELYGGATNNLFGLMFQNPLMNLMGSLVQKRTEMGIPIYHEWEHPSTKMSKVAQHIWNFWAPNAPMVPFTNEFLGMVDSFKGRPEAASPWEVVGSQLGFKIKSLDPTLVGRRHESMRKIQLGEARIMMNRELRNAVSDDERESIINRYRSIFQDINQPDE